MPSETSTSPSSPRGILRPLLEPRDEYALTRAIYLRALGVIYLCAFVSLWVQIAGLIGSDGILPAADYLSFISRAGRSAYWLNPTLCWFNSSDAFLNFLCGAGTVLSILLITGVAPIISTLLLWLFYLSLLNVGQVFLSYQWDLLLLEAGFLAIFLSPWTLRPRLSAPPGPSLLLLFLHRWLLFRLMFESGIVKMLGAGPLVSNSWRTMDAMRYHYFTQPLPPWTAWYMAQLSPRFKAFTVLVVFIAELGAPLLFFWPRRSRVFGFWITVIFQLLIIATGNYGFFNLLSIALCIPLMDDLFWLRWMRLWPRSRAAPAILPAASAPRPVRAIRFRWPSWLIAPLSLVLLVLTTLNGLLRCQVALPDWTLEKLEMIAPYGIANSYGLFATMTETRPELVIEGSDDGKIWKEYQFKWQDIDINRRPRFCIPHMPRLDWQMWFASLNALDENRSYWLLRFVQQLLAGSKPVIALLGDNPFPQRPPRYIRALLYDYRFTTTGDHTSAWWKRAELEESLPPLLLNSSGHLALVSTPRANSPPISRPISR